METVGKQVQVVSGLGVGGPVGPVGPVGADLHHHHHPHPHSLPPHPHAHPHGHPHGSHGHSLVGVTSTPGRGQTQPPVSHNQHLPARSTPVQLHRSPQSYVNIKSSSPVSPRTVGAGVTYVQGGAAASSAAAVAAAAAAGTAGSNTPGGPSIGGGGGSGGGGGGGGGSVNNAGGTNSGTGVVGSGAGVGAVGNVAPPGSGNSSGTGSGTSAGSNSAGSGTVGGAPGGYVAVPMAGGLRYIHPYPPTPTSASVPAVATVVTSASSASTPIPVAAPVVPAVSVNPPTVSQTPPPSLSGTAYSTRDVYRSATTNVNERIAINVSSSPLSQIGVGVGVVTAEYATNSGIGSGMAGGRGDRPRISLLPPASVTPTASPTALSDYQHVTSARNSRIGLMPVQPDQYCTRTAVEIANLQEAPPLKKMRLAQPTQVQLQSQSQSRCQSLSPADPCGKQEHVVQLQQPLRIDTREQPAAYTPQTEAISPTLPEPNTQEDAQFRSTKDDLLQQIAKVDREIAKRESQINKLRKKLKELEEAANKPLEASSLKRQVEEQSQQPKHQSLAQKIYAENRRKAEEAHRLLERLGAKVELPLYNQPSDTSVYQENRTKHQTCMRAKLIARLRREHAERASLHRQQSRTYAILVQEWHRKIERLEATQKRKSKEAKNREFFEKVFPELRKQREDKERFNRVGARIKSEADLEEIMDGLQEQEMEDKKMRSYAVIPPLLLDTKQRRIAFQNRNGLLQPEELEALHSERKLINVWSSVEHELFKEKYLQHPKNFGTIAQSLEHKSVPDCVHHYYLTKKAENYKQLLRKSRQRTRSSRNNPNNKVNNTSSSIGPIDILTTGVTTRLQREQQQKTQENPQNNSTAASTTTTTTTTSTSSNVSASVTSTIATTSATSLSSSATSSTCLTTESVITSTAAATTSILSTTTACVTSSITSSAKDNRETNKENKEIKLEPKESNLIKVEVKEEPQLSSETVSGKDVKVIIDGKSTLSSSTSSSLSVNATNTMNTTNATTIHMDFKDLNKKKPVSRETNSSGMVGVVTASRIKEKKKDNHATPMETSDEEAQSMDAIEGSRQIGPHACTVCQNAVEGSAQSRALPRSQASQYGLREDQVAPGARVCNTCRCKAVRGRYTACPLPGCPNLNNVGSKTRVKRLRALPAKWLDLPAEIRDPIIQEFQIPSNATKCCSACFNRISRRLAPHLTGSVEVAEDTTDSMARQWTDEELDQLRRALREHGTNWLKVAEQIPGKTNHQCKNYYFTYRKKLSLDQMVAEYYQSLGEERRPCLTDEEESGSSTSSCDELASSPAMRIVKRYEARADISALALLASVAGADISAPGTQRVHDSSDTASAGSPANNMSSGTPGTPGSSTNLPISFSRSADQKLGDKLADIAVVSLVPPVSIGSSQQSSTSGGSNAASAGTREDYDSSATETADEGQGGADLDNSNVVVTLTTTNNTTPLQQQHQQAHQQMPPASHSPPSTTSNSNPLTVKDLMLGVIEMQLKRNPNSPASTGSSSVPANSGTPTISSILKTDHRNDITFVREYKPSSSMANTTMSRDSNLATLSVVSGPHHGPPHRSAPSPQQIGQMQATITPCPPAASTSQSSSSDLIPKEGLIVMQVQQALRETEGTLDLSIKKPRQQQDYNHSLTIHKPPTVALYRPEPPPGAYYHPHVHPEQNRGAKSPLVYAPSPRPQAPLTPKMNKVTVPPPHPKLSPKLSSIGTPGHKSGSITHGTPVSSTRYDGLLRQMTPPGNPGNATGTPNVASGTSAGNAPNNQGPKETGSITQGTPVHPFAVDKRAPMYDYHRTIRHSPVTTGNIPGQGQSQAGTAAVVVTHSNQYNSYPSRPPPSYTMEQQLSSRQIIMNDYITSQQMHARSRSSGTSEGGNKNEPPTSTMYYTNTPPPQSHTQTRQGVIQRHNPQKQMHYPPPPPGLEAFSSLVDVAVQQPSLPVPHPHSHPASVSSSHEGLGKTMADRLLADRYGDKHRLAMHQADHRMAAAHHLQRDRERERDIVHMREKEEYRMHREKEIQQQEHRLAQQREKDTQHVEHRLSMQQREKDIQHTDHRLTVHQQREKEIHQQMAAAAAQREKEHQEHRLAVQQQRERDMHLQQQQQQQQLIQQQHIQQQQRMEAERRHIAQMYRDQQQQQLDRDASRLMSTGFTQSSRLQQPQQSQQQQQQQQQSSSRQSQSSNQQQNDSASTLTAASLIDAIITHQINQSVDNTGGNSQPQRPGDRLFQGFHREAPAEPNGMAHSPAGEGNGGNSGTGGASGNGSGNKPITLGEHVDHIVSKDYGPPHPSYRSYSGYQISEDQWKRRKANESDSVKAGDERQIIRVTQQQSQQQQQQQQQQHQQAASSVGKQQFHSVEPVSPPEAGTNHYGRRLYETTTATSTSGTPSNKPHLSPLDYVKNKIVEVMRTSEDDKGGNAGDRNGGNVASGEKDEKIGGNIESPSGAEMMVDGTPNQTSQPPAPAPTTTFYPFSALGVHTGPPPAPPPPTSGSASVTKSEQMQAEPAPLLSAQYEPLSDED